MKAARKLVSEFCEELSCITMRAARGVAVEETVAYALTIAATENVATVSMVEAMMPRRLIRISRFTSTRISSGSHEAQRYAMVTQSAAAIPMIEGFTQRLERISRRRYSVFVTCRFQRFFGQEASRR